MVLATSSLPAPLSPWMSTRSEEHTSELQSQPNLVCRLLLENKDSQIPDEYALPSLFRSRPAVVSGDEKQMPPTAFFSTRVENGEADFFECDDVEDESTHRPR